MAASYNAINDHTSSSPYASGSPYYAESTGYITPHPAPKKRTNKWLKIGVPVLVIIIIAAVVGGVLGSRKSNKDASSSGSKSDSSSDSPSASAAASSAASVKLALGQFATATNSEFMVPLYPSTTNTAAFAAPTFVDSTNSKLAWPADPFQPANPSRTTVRTDRPRLFAPQYKWQALPNLIANDPYLKGWNDTIFGNATAYYSLVPVVYHMDGTDPSTSSGILDNAREIKMRIKAFAYAYRMSNDTKWVDRCWEEVNNAATFGPDTDKWNNGHFLDSAEFASAFGIAYDWLYDKWTDAQKSTMRATMIKYALQPGIDVFENSASFGWWSGNDITGNWNCVCNGGLTVGSLAILNDDTTGIAARLLSHTVDNALKVCVNAVSDDGTWAETANYWYFGTTGHAEMASALKTATGSDYGLLDTNTNFWKTGLYHMYAYGPTSLFNYGDHGPNKFSTTANSMFLYGEHYNQPAFVLHQRDRADAAEPWSMFWYDPTVTGAFWENQPLDHFFDNSLDQWGSMRSSWTDQSALFLAIKAGLLQKHQTHNDLDVGDFVLDALGTRWAGEFGSGDYLSPGYFSNDTQGSDRWMYYRKMTEGQNTILIGKTNQLVTAAPSVSHGTTNDTQGPTTVINLDSSSTAFWKTDMTSAYGSATNVQRGARLLNSRRQVLIQDEITASADVEWRMQTNATISIDSGGTSATLTLDGQTMKVSMLNAPSGATFSQSAAQRLTSDVTPPAADQENPGVSVLIIALPAGTYSLQVLFNPQWPGMSANDFVTPPSVPLSSWSLTSHN